MQKKKTEIITARMTLADKETIYRKAKAVGMTVTNYLTTCALGKEIVRVEGLDDLLSELKAQGRNLNQLTTPPSWTDSKQRRREALKNLAMGQKFGGDQHHEQTM